VGQRIDSDSDDEEEEDDDEEEEYSEPWSRTKLPEEPQTDAFGRFEVFADGRAAPV
jgi:hypothetical protein